jgi:transposase
MKIIGCDFHPSWQQVAIFDSETGEIEERKVSHGGGEAEGFYRALGEGALIGIEACGNSQWFIDLVEQLGHEVWVGDAAKIRASYVRKQKTDRRDAGHILKLLLEKRFPRLWVPTGEMRDQRQLLIHRHKLVEIRSRVKNHLQHLAMNRGMQKKSRLWTQKGMAEFQQLTMPGWAGERRRDLLGLLEQLNGQIASLDRAVERQAAGHAEARLLMSQPGVGPVTALAFVLTIGEVTRFAGSKQLTSYLGLIPSEYTSGKKRRLGAISKQGNRFLRMLLVEAAQTAVRKDEGFRKEYQRRCHRRPKGVAKVAAARKLAVRLYWMLRTNVGYPEIAHVESNPRVALVGKTLDR